MLRRKFTLDEAVQMCVLAAKLQVRGEKALGDLIAQLAGGDDSVLPALHDALNVTGRHAMADRLRKLIFEDD